MGEVLAWLEAAQADAARTQRNLPVSAPLAAGGVSVVSAGAASVGATANDETRGAVNANAQVRRLVVGRPEVTPQ